MRFFPLLVWIVACGDPDECTFGGKYHVAECDELYTDCTGGCSMSCGNSIDGRRCNCDGDLTKEMFRDDYEWDQYWKVCYEELPDF